MTTNVHSLIWAVLSLLCGSLHSTLGDQYSRSVESDSSSNNLYTIEGKVVSLDKKPSPDWVVSTQIFVNGGEHIGLLREDGTFVVNGLYPGSYIVEVINPGIAYESARVEITSKGKLRSRKVNHLQPALVNHVPYPLRLNPIGKFQ